MNLFVSKVCLAFLQLGLYLLHGGTLERKGSDQAFNVSH